MSIILHITKREDWEKAKTSGCYQAGTLDTEGFIHCSKPDQIIDVANCHFRGQSGLVLLCIDSEKVKSEIRYENLEGGKKLFPHIYGPLDLKAVVDVLDFRPQGDGNFELPVSLIY